MVVDPQVVGTVQILVGCVALSFLKPALTNREKPGSSSFAVFVSGVALYAFASGLDLFVADYTISVWTQKAVVIAGVVITTAWFLLAVAVTDQPAQRLLATGIGGYTVAAALITVVNPGNVVVGSGTELRGPHLWIDPGLAWWLFIGGGYLLILIATGLLALDSVRSTGIRRKQLGLLALAIVPTFAGSLIDVAAPAITLQIYEVIVYGFTLSAGIFGLALYSGYFLDVTPVARRVAMGEMEAAIVTLDDEDHVVDCNRRARELFDVEDYVGLPAAAFFDVLPATAVEAVTGTSDTELEVMAPIDGDPRHFSVGVTPIDSYDGEARIVVLYEITDQKRREHELERKNERLDRFASVVSHDLRGPLGVAETYFEVAETDDPNLEAVEDAHDRMRSMIDDLLVMAKSDTIVEDTETLALDSFVQEVWVTSQNEGGTLETDLSDEATIEGDPDLLRNVFENLFRNAVDHNDRTVTVRVGMLDGGGVYVEDDGEGIPPDKREAVLEHGYTTSDEGTGLGLFIVQEFVRAHGWTLTVTAGADGGARFEIQTNAA